MSEDRREYWMKVCGPDDPELDQKLGEAVVDAVLAAVGVLTDSGVPFEQVSRTEFKHDPTMVYVRVLQGEDSLFVFRTCTVFAEDGVYLASTWLPTGLAGLSGPGPSPRSTTPN